MQHSVKHFHHYLFGRSFRVRSDHGALKWLINFKSPEGQLARWFEILAAYDFCIEHRAGLKHGNADGLSRRPCQHNEYDCKYCSRAEAKGEEVVSILKQDIVQCQEVDQVIEVAANVVTRSKTKEETSLFTDLDLSTVLSSEKVSELQKLDPCLKMVFPWVESRNRPKWQEISDQNEEVKYFWSRFDSLEIKDSVLCWCWKSKGKPDEFHIVVPKSMHTFILNQLHDSPTGGHLGIDKTFHKVRDRFCWFKMRSFVEQWCKNCDVCAGRKSVKKKQKSPLQQYIVGAPMERVAMDIMGPLAKTKHGNCYMLVIVDYFTKWVTAVPIRDQRAETIADVFVEKFVSIFGLPLSLHSDQGTNFCSNIMSNVCRILGVNKTNSVPYRPQSDG